MATLKKRNFILNFALLAAILVSWWLVEYISATGLGFKTKQTDPKQINAFMTGAHYSAFNSQGQLQTQLYSPSVKHKPYQNSSTFVTPVITHYTHKKNPWVITAKTGTAVNGIDTIHLADDVKIKQRSGPNNPETTLLTSYLTVYPHTQIAVTDRHVSVSQPGSLLETTGARINFKTNKVELLSQAEGQTLVAKN